MGIKKRRGIFAVENIKTISPIVIGSKDGSNPSGEGSSPSGRTNYLQTITTKQEKHMKAELVLGNLKREREALNSKLERLETALAKEWQDTDQEYLCAQQYNAMSLYAHILDERITDIEIKLEEKKAQKEYSHETSHIDCNSFNKDVDLEAYKKYLEDYAYKNCVGCCDNEDKEEEEDNVIESILSTIEDVFNIKIIR